MLHKRVKGIIREKRLIKLIILIGVIFSLICVFIVVGMRLYYQPFFESAKREFIVPALEDDFVPQGVDYCEEYNLFLISGYVCEEEQAKICVVDPNEEYRIVSVLDENENELISHAGGISHSENYVYLAGCDGKCYVLSLSELISKEVTSIPIMGSFSTYNQSSFCSVKDNQLFVGEYYYPIKYATDASHYFITPEGEENNAVVMVFSLDDTLPLGVCDIPEMALSITERIQGMCFIEDNKLVMSASSVFQGSQLYTYDYQKALTNNLDKLSVAGNEIPLLFLDSDTLVDSIEVLPKSEGVTVCEDELFVIFESASNKFKYGKLLDGEYVYSMPIEQFMKR